MKRNILRVLSVFVIAALLCSCGGPGSSRNGAALNAGEGVYYEMFIRSFADSNGDGIGDLPGAISKLDYFERRQSRYRYRPRCNGHLAHAGFLRATPITAMM